MSIEAAFLAALERNPGHRRHGSWWNVLARVERFRRLSARLLAPWPRGK